LVCLFGNMDLLQNSHLTLTVLRSLYLAVLTVPFVFIEPVYESDSTKPTGKRHSQCVNQALRNVM
jgi:hypothetical protein